MSKAILTELEPTPDSNFNGGKNRYWATWQPWLAPMLAPCPEKQLEPLTEEYKIEFEDLPYYNETDNRVK